MKNADMPAMPTPVMESGSTAHGTEPTYGKTKREEFAAMAMQGLLSNDSSSSISYIAESAVTYADALLAELERTE